VASRLAAFVVSLFLLASASAGEQPSPSKQSRVDVAADARAAFFLRSDLTATQRLTESGLTTHPGDPELLFLRMEAATLEADSATTLIAAVELCKVLRTRPDARGFVAATRILDLAGNSIAFRDAVPKIQGLLSAGSPYADDLRNGLVQAARDGVRNISLLDASHAAGLLTDWRIAGPYGTHSYADFDRSFAPEHDSLKRESSGGLAVERVRYEDGALVLPDYFSHSGIFYAEADMDLQQPATRVLRIDSAGTLEIFLDGKSRLNKDDRFRAGPEVVSVGLHLAAGRHTVLVKFIPDALPIRVSLFAETKTERTSEVRLGDDQASSLEAGYLNALLAFRSADYEAAIAQLASLRDEHSFAAGDLLAAESWAEVANQSPEGQSLLNSAVRLAPDAAQAEYLLAKSAEDEGRIDEAWQRISRVTAAHPFFAQAQRLRADIAIPRNWTVDAIAATENEIEASPSCDSLLHAHKFYAEHEQFDRAKALESHIDGCAPDSTAYAALLGASGRHAEAVQAATTLLAANPLSRDAYLVLIRELALSGRYEDAHRAAIQLSNLAPNSERFRRLGSASAEVLALSDDDEDARDFAAEHPFYAPYRRDAMAIAREDTPAKYSGLTAITLVDDKVSQLRPNGSVAVYVHRLTRVLTREGVESFGEVSVPEDADILELRTLKTNGEVAEPEFNQHKNTVSMPALSPGDTIEQEYVVRYGHGGIEARPKEFSFTFGSLSGPVAQSRFVALTPESLAITTRQLAGAPSASARVANGERVQIWEGNDLPRSPEETSLPMSETRPTIKLYEIPGNGWLDVREDYRERLIRAACIGPRVMAAVNAMQVTSLSAEDKLLRLYSFVNDRIRDDRSSLEDDTVTTAEDSLATGEGNRPVTLIALARAAGLSADLLLARDVSASSPVTSIGAFTRPLVRVHFPLTGKSVVLDIQSQGMTLGGVSPRLDRREALLVPLHIEEEDDKPLMPFSSRQTEQSTAAGDLRVSSTGELQSKVTITLGS
jgi:tetratricopeptide (TPR) repeat protein